MRGRVPPLVTAAATLGCVIAYSVLVGLAPSVIRAALMGAVAACGLAFGRRGATVNGLALAVAAMVAADPSTITDVGFLLSATATGGLLFLGDPLSERLAFLPVAIRRGPRPPPPPRSPPLPFPPPAFGPARPCRPPPNSPARRSL